MPSSDRSHISTVHEFLEIVEEIKPVLSSKDYLDLCNAAKFAHQMIDASLKVEIMRMGVNGELLPLSSRHQRLLQRSHFAALRDVIKDYRVAIAGHYQ